MYNHVCFGADDIISKVNNMSLEGKYNLLKEKTSLVDNEKIDKITKIDFTWEEIHISFKSGRVKYDFGLDKVKYMFMEERYNLLKKMTHLVDNIPLDSIKQIEITDEDNYILLKDGTFIGNGDSYGESIKYINLTNLYEIFDVRIVITNDNRFIEMGSPSNTEKYLHNYFQKYKKIILTPEAIVCLTYEGTLKIVCSDTQQYAFIIDYKKLVYVDDIGVVDDGNWGNIIIKKNNKAQYLLHTIEISDRLKKRCLFDKTDLNNTKDIKPYIIF